MAQQTQAPKKSAPAKRSKSAAAKPAAKSAAAKVAKQQETEGFSPDERQRMIAYVDALPVA